jgi:hypothetical protein
MAQEEKQTHLEDQAWFDELSGKTDSAQAARLRKVLREAELSDAAKEDTTHDWERLQFALRREKAKPKVQVKYFAIAASLLIVMGTVSLLMPKNETSNLPPPQSATMMRGMSTQVIFSKTPEQDAIQLEAELVRLGVKVSRRGEVNNIELQIALTYPVKDAVRAALESRVIPVPEQGELTVAFIAATN